MKRRCVDCGGSLTGRPPRAYLCDRCRLERKRFHRRAWAQRERRDRPERVRANYRRWWHRAHPRPRKVCATLGCTKTFRSWGTRLFCDECRQIHAEYSWVLRDRRQREKRRAAA